MKSHSAHIPLLVIEAALAGRLSPNVPVLLGRHAPSKHSVFSKPVFDEMRDVLFRKMSSIDIRTFLHGPGAGCQVIHYEAKNRGVDCCWYREGIEFVALEVPLDTSLSDAWAHMRDQFERRTPKAAVTPPRTDRTRIRRWLQDGRTWIDLRQATEEVNLRQADATKGMGRRAHVIARAALLSAQTEANRALRMAGKRDDAWRGVGHVSDGSDAPARPRFSDDNPYVVPFYKFSAMDMQERRTMFSRARQWEEGKLGEVVDPIRALQRHARRQEPTGPSRTTLMARFRAYVASGEPVSPDAPAQEVADLALGAFCAMHDAVRGQGCKVGPDERAAALRTVEYVEGLAAVGYVCDELVSSDTARVERLAAGNPRQAVVSLVLELFTRWAWWTAPAPLVIFDPQAENSLLVLAAEALGRADRNAPPKHPDLPDDRAGVLDLYRRRQRIEPSQTSSSIVPSQSSSMPRHASFGVGSHPSQTHPSQTHSSQSSSGAGPVLRLVPPPPDLDALLARRKAAYEACVSMAETMVMDFIPRPGYGLEQMADLGHRRYYRDDLSTALRAVQTLDRELGGQDLPSAAERVRGVFSQPGVDRAHLLWAFTTGQGPGEVPADPASAWTKQFEVQP